MIERFQPKEIPSSNKMNQLVDAANNHNDVTAPALGVLDRDFGKYAQIADVTLTPVYTGKRFNSEGKLVDDANWNVGRFGAVERGLLYELYMGSEDNMVPGTALFVSHTVEKVSSVNKDVYTPLFSAMGTSLPVSTYAVLWAGNNYDDLLVSYRNDVVGANVMKSASWGIFKSIATQYANLNAKVDLKTFSDAYYQGMRVGIADALANINGATIDYKEKLTAGRMINNAPDLMTSNREPDATKGVSTITVKSVTGDVVGGNQIGTLVGTEYNKTSVGISWTDCRCDLHKNLKINNGHKYLVLFSANRDDDGSGNAIVQLYDNKDNGNINFNFNTNGTKSFIISCTKDSNNALLVFLPLNYNYVMSGINIDVVSQPLIDLTTIFPSAPTFVNALGQNDAIKVLHRIGIFIYEAPISNPTAVVQLEGDTLQKGAEIIAKLGYQPDPKLWFGSCGRIKLVDGASGLVKQSINMIEQKKKAWQGVLAALTEQGIAIPDFAQTPIEFGVNDSLGVEWDEKGVTVKTWLKEGTEAAEGEIIVGNTIIYPLATPIRIDFDEPMHFDLVNAQPDDLICLDDIDGEPMYKVDIENYAKEDGTNYRKTSIYPSPEWVEKHKQLPVSLNATLQNIGTSFNSAFLVNLVNRITALEGKIN